MTIKLFEKLNLFTHTHTQHFKKQGTFEHTVFFLQNMSAICAVQLIQKQKLLSQLNNFRTSMIFNIVIAFSVKNRIFRHTAEPYGLFDEHPVIHKKLIAMLMNLCKTLEKSIHKWTALYVSLGWPVHTIPNAKRK